MSRESRFTIASIVCALLAAVLTFAYAGHAGGGDGPTIPVAYTTAPLESGSLLDEAATATLDVRQVPSRAAASDAVGDPVELAGERLIVDLPAGAPITKSALGGDQKGRGAYRLRSGERALQIEVVAAGEEVDAGARVDLFASGIGGTEQTQQLIDSAEVLSVDEGTAPSKPRLTVRLAAAQVAAVVRADVFARELRAVPVPDGKS